ncbi:MAG TPA: large conductance mechanosensitive channel protein MscL [Anaerolineae bacterium]|nr:large conductance mechanosensitive channel protein MscL [Anaerolineae bacterium]
MWSAYKNFIFKGNAFDLAVGVIIGAAFGAITKSLIDDIIMPLLSLFTGRLDFTNWFWALDGNTYTTLAEAQEAGTATVNYGLFLNAVLNLMLVGFVLFIIVRQINRTKKEKPVELPNPSNEELLLTEIRDLLAQQTNPNANKPTDDTSAT